MMKLTGAGILIESLIEHGVDTIFGYPGGAVLNIYDELSRYRKRIRHILVSHEQHAAHAADGYARSTGKAGVCLATSGPGATNLVTGIATAFADSVPVVAVTGNASLSLLGKDSFQEVDIAGITMPVVKHNWIVEDVNDIAETVREAFIVAQSGRPGPVLIDIPRDVICAVCKTGIRNEADRSGECNNGDCQAKSRAVRLSERTKRKTFNDSGIDRAVSLINKSRRPLIYAGGGVIRSGAGAQLVKLAEILGSPVALSLMGMGAIPADHPLCAGLTGMHGTAASCKAVKNCDLLIALGARFSDRVTGGITGNDENQFAKNAKIIHIDIDPAEINKNKDCDEFITGDIKAALDRLLKKLPPRNSPCWAEMTDELKSGAVIQENRKTTEFLHPRFIIRKTAQALGENAVVVTDVGQHQIWTAQYYPFKNQRGFLSSGGMGTMGFGMGAACGAKTANPGNPVVLFTGDGSFRMNCAEMATLVKYKLPVLIIVFNNRTLGMLRQWQGIFYRKNYFETSLENMGPDFVKLAGAYSVRGFRVTDEDSFLEALNNSVKILALQKPALIEVIIDKDEKAELGF